MAVHESFLVYRQFRFLKAATLLSLLSIVVYAAYDPIGTRNGGTFVGYGLGTVGFGLILWLAYLGYRKRRYDLGPTQLKAWVSAHVYLGLSLLVVGTLHTGFSFGWNVHTLAYGLMVAVILSGVFGVYAYQRYPTLMTANRAGQTLDAMIRAIAEIDRQCTEIAMTLGDDIATAIRTSQSGTRIGGSAWEQLTGVSRGNPLPATIARVNASAMTAETAAAERAARLSSLLARKAILLERCRADIRFKAQMEIWLLVHVPLSIMLIAALTIHVIAVFFYW